MKTILGLLSILVSVAYAEPKKAVRPSDWSSHFVPMVDSRPKPSKNVGSSDCQLEIIEMAYASEKPKAGAILLIPGFFQNSFLFDPLPSQGISFARYLMREKGL